MSIIKLSHNVVTRVNWLCSTIFITEKSVLSARLNTCQSSSRYCYESSSTVYYAVFKNLERGNCYGSLLQLSHRYITNFTLLKLNMQIIFLFATKKNSCSFVHVVIISLHQAMELTQKQPLHQPFESARQWLSPAAISIT